MATYEELRASKIAKLKAAREKGINPYPYAYERTHLARAIQTDYAYLKEGEASGKKAKVAGKLMSVRGFGKLAFLDVHDDSGKIQIQLKQETTPKTAWEILSLLDAGDYIGVEGEIVRTQRGELSVLAGSLTLLSKSIAPMPDKWHGISDIETRYRQRHIDLFMNPEVKKIFLERSKIIQTMRRVLDENGFVEVEIPTLQSSYGGANAKPFITHSNALDQDLYLSISPELQLKKLLIGNMEKVYTITKNFRNEDIDKTHNPEFTTMECYAAYWDYTGMMTLTEDILGRPALRYTEQPLFRTKGRNMI
ncbi:MAG: amino acid--tRNA ligase-related protein [archaeon]|nr:amino acid--tRNA ligase-related protein [archaeon]